MSLPPADDLFRPTSPTSSEAGSAESDEAVETGRQASTPASTPGSASEAADAPPRQRARRSRPSGRVRHDEKMTVYITSEELMALEHARLALRGVHGLAVDRGRLVREAIAMALVDFEAQGEESALVRRLSEE